MKKRTVRLQNFGFTSKKLLTAAVLEIRIGTEAENAQVLEYFPRPTTDPTIGQAAIALF